MSKGRLEAFSDGVIAIIITIMVLELKIPKPAAVYGYFKCASEKNDLIIYRGVPKDQPDVTYAGIEKLEDKRTGWFVAGKEVYPNGNVYCGTKFAVDAITKGSRIDLLPYNIKVTQIAPGAADTEFSVVRF